MRNSTVICAVLGVAVWLASGAALGEPVINTIAGGGPNNLPALSANLSFPVRVAVDSNGTKFIAAAGQHRVFAVDGSGQLTVIAGDGVEGFGGDGGPAIGARLDGPAGVALDAYGNVYISDSGNHRIRRIDRGTGVITTVVGTGASEFSGDDGPATEAGLGSPGGIALDGGGNLYIAERTSHRIRRVDSVTGIISTYAGSGVFGSSGDGGPATAARFWSPTDVALDAAGNLLVADKANHRIRRVDSVTGVITTVAGSDVGFSGDGGPATSARLFAPSGVAVDAQGNILIADTENFRIRRVNGSSGIITTVAGRGRSVISFFGDGGAATDAGLHYPSGVAFDLDGNLLIADTDNRRVRHVDAGTGIITTIAGGDSPGDGNLATSVGLGAPRGMVFDEVDNLLIAVGNRIRAIDAETGIIATVAGDGAGRFNGDGRTATRTSLNLPGGLAFDAARNLFIADTENSRIRRVDAVTGIVTTVAGSTSFGGFSGDEGPATEAQLWGPSGIAFDAAGNLLIADTRNSRVRRVEATSGIITTVAGSSSVGGFGGDGGAATAANLNRPSRVAVDGRGNVLIADTSNHRIRRVDAETGIITTVAGSNSMGGFGGDGDLATTARFSFPEGIALDFDGSLLIADAANHRVRRVDAATGIVATVVGSSSEGDFGGDGGPAAGARLNSPSELVLGEMGNLYIADAGNNRVRKVAEPTLAIAVDIKPGSNPNSINPVKPGVIPVAILGSEGFDVSEIDGSSLTFAAGEAAPAHDLVDPMIFTDHLEDVNGDGITDLVSHYRTEEAGIAYGDMTACLRGSTVDGIQFNECDAVRTVPDMDGDQLLDVDEQAAGTNAFYRDSDNDGYDDGMEVLTLATDPLDALDPAPAPVGEKEKRRQRNRRR